MKRREFITLLGGAAAAWPFAARAQQATSRPLIGILSPLSRAAAARNIEALRAGLRELGYVEDRNIVLELRFAEGMPRRLPDLAAELVALKPDVISLVRRGASWPPAMQREQFRSSCWACSKTPLQWGWSVASLDPAAILPEPGRSGMMRWSGRGSSFSSMWCPDLRGSGSSSILAMRRMTLCSSCCRPAPAL